MRAAKLCALVALCALVSASAAAEPKRIVILPVVVHSAAADPTYVSQGLADMLSARLEQQGGVDVVRVDESAAATSRLAQALDAGRRAGGDYVMFGSFTQFGDGASLDIQCAPLQGEGDSRTIFIQSGSMGEIIPKLDELADKVARYLGSPARPKETPEVATNGAGSADELTELRRRLQELERAVFPPAIGATEGAGDAAPAEVSDADAAETDPAVPES